MKILELVLNDHQLNDNHRKQTKFTPENLSYLVDYKYRDAGLNFLVSAHSELAEEVNNNNNQLQGQECPKDCDGLLEIFYGINKNIRDKVTVHAIATSHRKKNKKHPMTKHERGQAIDSIFNKFFAAYGDSILFGKSFNQILVIPYIKAKDESKMLAIGNHSSTPFDDEDRDYIALCIERLKAWDEFYIKEKSQGTDAITIIKKARVLHIITDQQMMALNPHLPSAPAADDDSSLYPAAVSDLEQQENESNANLAQLKQRLFSNPELLGKSTAQQLAGLYKNNQYQPHELQWFVHSILVSCNSLEELKCYEDFIDQLNSLPENSDFAFLMMPVTMPYKVALIKNHMLNYLRKDVIKKNRPDEKLIQRLESLSSAEEIINFIDDNLHPVQQDGAVYLANLSELLQGRPLLMSQGNFFKNFGLKRGSDDVRREIYEFYKVIKNIWDMVSRKPNTLFANQIIRFGDEESIIRNDTVPTRSSSLDAERTASSFKEPEFKLQYPDLYDGDTLIPYDVLAPKQVPNGDASISSDDTITTPPPYNPEFTESQNEFSQDGSEELLTAEESNEKDGHASDDDIMSSYEPTIHGPSTSYSSLFPPVPNDALPTYMEDTKRPAKPLLG